jgi:cystathionine beta-lyase family protein involved in aluminum resistance
MTSFYRWIFRLLLSFLWLWKPVVPFTISPFLKAPGFKSPILKKAVDELQNRFQEIDMHTMSSMNKILHLYKEQRIDPHDFHGVNGYGHGDIGREKFDNIIAKLMGGEKAIVRLQFFSGTHAISTALFGCLRPGDEFLSVSGQPYDTLEEVIGMRKNQQTNDLRGSLKDWGIKYHQLDLKIKGFGLTSDSCAPSGSPAVEFDFEKIKETLDQNPSIKLVHVQR